VKFIAPNELTTSVVLPFGALNKSLNPSSAELKRIAEDFQLELEMEWAG
jgi:hypothetical protein